MRTSLHAHFGLETEVPRKFCFLDNIELSERSITQMKSEKKRFWFSVHGQRHDESNISKLILFSAIQFEMMRVAEEAKVGHYGISSFLTEFHDFCRVKFQFYITKSSLISQVVFSV